MARIIMKSPYLKPNSGGGKHRGNYAKYIATREGVEIAEDGYPGLTKEEASLKISYKPLWKQLIDKDLKKKDLCELAGISPASVTKMGKCGHVTTETLEKICVALDCRVEDILELQPGEQEVMPDEEAVTQEITMEMTM